MAKINSFLSNQNNYYLTSYLEKDSSGAVTGISFSDNMYTDSNIGNLLIKSETTLGYKVGSGSPKDYTVTDAEMRQHMLGTYTKGVCDRAIDYLLDAQTTIGAYGMRLQATGSNLVIALENEQASESTIRDADMAKEMTEFVRANLLTQASQAMLAQANQTAGGVLSLLG